MMKTGRYCSIQQLAPAKKNNSSYVSRLLRLTLLSPDIVEAILDGRQAAEMTLLVLMEPFAVEWEGHSRPSLSGRVRQPLAHLSVGLRGRAYGS